MNKPHRIDGNIWWTKDERLPEPAQELLDRLRAGSETDPDERASLLGCSQQRAVQLALVDGFPAPYQEASRKRLWHRSEIETWAEHHWWGTRPWRVRTVQP